MDLKMTENSQNVILWIRVSGFNIVTSSECAVFQLMDTL
jgi:hypothetical protein